MNASFLKCIFGMCHKIVQPYVSCTAVACLKASSQKMPDTKGGYTLLCSKNKGSLQKDRLERYTCLGGQESVSFRIGGERFITGRTNTYYSLRKQYVFQIQSDYFHLNSDGAKRLNEALMKNFGS